MTIKDKITDIFLTIYYNEKYPIEKYYETAEYINGRMDRAIKEYRNDFLFHTKVKTASAYMFKMFNDFKEEREDG